MGAQLYGSVNLALAGMAPNVTKAIYHRGDATGDIPHVLAAMANDAALGVVVIDGHKTKAGGLAAVANVMVDHFGVSASRVKFVSDTTLVIPKPGKSGSTLYVDGRKFTMYPLTKSTNFIRDQLAGIAVNPHVFKNIKGSLRGNTLHKADITDEGGHASVDVMNLNFLDPQCAAFWHEWGISFDTPTVVLWGRESGRGGGMHADYDHSYTGMRQIMDQCLAGEVPYQVIVAGDYRSTNEHGEQTGPRNGIAAGATVIGKYWDTVPLFKDRFNQVRLFYVLKKMLKVRDCKLVHVGMRSGGLDMFGFSGQRTIYISAATGDERMAPVATAFQTAGLGTTYQKFSMDELPKRGVHHSKNKGNREKNDRGFFDEDLDDLMMKVDAALA